MDEEIAVEFTGPDGDGFVWATTRGPDGIKMTNLGNVEQAAEAMCQWLGSIDYKEREVD